ncbi:hypothetical protein ACWT_5785 [Actinoplanes sp. SE50]|nr:hypothetical protein ACPL_5916 [Actinoplanes sp. SE50/110]ATO85200.1 hypothetical protein ACWT_5785 [Actinoplanes sp. SE50]SLM02610.1 hypothetical protein ACSP50_5892 [Actinoplanes sp. SE50/110]
MVTGLVLRLIGVDAIAGGERFLPAGFCCTIGAASPGRKLSPRWLSASPVPC